MKKIIPWLVRIFTGIFSAGAISLTFTFIHRSVLKLGGFGHAAGRIVHEDFYGGVLFVLFLGGFLLFPLPQKWEYFWAALRSAFLTGGIALCITILGQDSGSSTNLMNLVVIASVLFYGAFLLSSGCFQRLITKQSEIEQDGKD